MRRNMALVFHDHLIINNRYVTTRFAAHRLKAQANPGPLIKIDCRERRLREGAVLGIIIGQARTATLATRNDSREQQTNCGNHRSDPYP